MKATHFTFRVMKDYYFQSETQADFNKPYAVTIATFTKVIN